MTETPKISATEIPTERLYPRMPADVKATLRRTANLNGQSLSGLVVSSALAAAEKTIREHEAIVLSPRDSITFLDAILNPKGPNEALLRAARRHRELFGPFESDND